MKVLVVGGAGYIGSHTARLVRKHGHEVLIYDNLSTGHKLLANGFELIVGDIGDSKTLTAAMGGIEAVMHFAADASVGESIAEPRKYFKNNVQAALGLLNIAMDTGVRHFVFSSSCAVYGIPTQVPISEQTSREPINPYGISKLCFEHALEAYSKAYNLHVAALRYFNAAGADESGEIGELHDPESHLIPIALAAACGRGPELQVFGTDYPTPDGTCIRDYVHVNDLAEAHVLALKELNAGTRSLFLNLGTGSGHSIKEILVTIENVTGKSVPWRPVARRPGDPPVLVADATRARELLGWKPQRTLQEIVSTAWGWMQKGARCANASSK